MTRNWLAAMTVLTSLCGSAMAETVTTTTTESTTPYIAPVAPPPPPPIYVAPAPTTQTVTQRSVDSDGVVRSQTTTTARGVTPWGDMTTTRRTVETTTER